MGTPIVPPALGNIGIIELLECDSRPSFILDLERTQDPFNEHLHKIFCNKSLLRLPRIFGAVELGQDSPAENTELEQCLQFKEWATTSPEDRHVTQGHTTPFQYQELLWTESTLRKRWRIIIGSPIGLKDSSAASFPSLSAGTVQKGNDGTSAESKARKENEKLQERVQSTWVDDLPVSEHVQLFKSKDWSATALGPLETWSACLRQMTCFLMSDSRAACILWYRPTI